MSLDTAAAMVLGMPSAAMALKLVNIAIAGTASRMMTVSSSAGT